MRFITDPKVPPWDVQLNTVPEEVKIASDSDVQMGIAQRGTRVENG